MENLRNVRMPAGGPGSGRLARVLVLGGAAVWGASNSLFNVEGGHRAIVFNRLTGVKENVKAGHSLFWTAVHAWSRIDQEAVLFMLQCLFAD